MKRAFFLAAPALMLALGGTAFAAEHEVHMLNKGEAGMMVFEPAFVKAEPGDVIHFIPTDKSHNVEAIKDILARGRGSLQKQDQRGIHADRDRAGLVRRQMHAAFRDGHGGSDSGG
jgi:plastocyanin